MSIPDEWVDSAAQALHRSVCDMGWKEWDGCEWAERHARPVLDAVLPDVLDRLDDRLCDLIMAIRWGRYDNLEPIDHAELTLELIREWKGELE